MRLKHTSGSEVDVTENKAKALIAMGSWSPIDDTPVPEPTESVWVDPPDPVNEDIPTPESVVEESDSGTETKPAPTIQEMRTWALNNNIEGVRTSGKLPRHAVEAYLASHEEE